MSETIRVEIDRDLFRGDLQGLREDLQATIDEDLVPLAENVQGLFQDIGQSLVSELTRAAEKGRLSVDSIVDAILKDVAALAVDQVVRQPINGVLNQIFGGTRAGGGAVLPGQSYLVGEQGPEIFRPATAGQVTSRVQPTAVTVTISGGSGRDSLGRSDSQIASHVARKLGKAHRNA
ncbi:hypothetical protein [Parvularcula sp. LCG005]|uniref:hypothetical protein n=1 Tax=Parvularcula sp. LCG005 TaxID=3078805 RepID=UPI0029435267|nr:hypothetical protein [Parvularcula sp. LCG005]WOI53998.1 hypothetical protein RUI03_03095 [Parvularcula sp. LCG005]